MWLDLDASEDNIETRDVSKYRILHIATHGLLNAERPQFTGVVLSLVGNKNEDGFLRTDEVFNLRLGRSAGDAFRVRNRIGKRETRRRRDGPDARVHVCRRADRRRELVVRCRQVYCGPDDGFLQATTD